MYHKCKLNHIKFLDVVVDNTNYSFQISMEKLSIDDKYTALAYNEQDPKPIQVLNFQDKSLRVFFDILKSMFDKPTVLERQRFYKYCKTLKHDYNSCIELCFDNEAKRNTYKVVFNKNGIIHESTNNYSRVHKEPVYLSKLENSTLSKFIDNSIHTIDFSSHIEIDVAIDQTITMLRIPSDFKNFILYTFEELDYLISDIVNDQIIWDDSTHTTDEYKTSILTEATEIKILFAVCYYMYPLFIQSGILVVDGVDCLEHSTLAKLLKIVEEGYTDKNKMQIIVATEQEHLYTNHKASYKSWQNFL